MKTYSELIEQNFSFPTEEFSVLNNELYFHGIRLLDIIEKYDSPIKVTYLPKIEENIKKVQDWFAKAIAYNNYTGYYTYTFCTKASHFKFILDKTLSCGAQLETSSEYDISILRKLYEDGKISKQTLVLSNGFKRPRYLTYISELINEGFNCIPILDNIDEIDDLAPLCSQAFGVGIRVATNEEPDYA